MKRFSSTSLRDKLCALGIDRPTAEALSNTAREYALRHGWYALCGLEDDYTRFRLWPHPTDADAAPALYEVLKRSDVWEVLREFNPMSLEAQALY